MAGEPRGRGGFTALAEDQRKRQRKHKYLSLHTQDTHGHRRHTRAFVGRRRGDSGCGHQEVTLEHTAQGQTASHFQRPRPCLREGRKSLNAPRPLAMRVPPGPCTAGPSSRSLSPCHPEEPGASPPARRTGRRDGVAPASAARESPAAQHQPGARQMLVE